MTKFFSVSLVMLAFLSLGEALAGYDRTKWGMSIKQVKGIYPGGRIEKGQNGETTISMVRPVGNLMTGYVMFRFHPKRGLENVTILFPKQGSKVDLENGTYVEDDIDGCQRTMENLRISLTLKYGPPVTAERGGDPDSPVWLLDKNDGIWLIKPTPKSDRCTVALTYDNTKTLFKQLQEGL